MKKILLFLLLPLFSFSQDRGCNWSVGIGFSYSINDSTNYHKLYSYSAPFPVTVFSDTSTINAFMNDSLTFYYGMGEGGLEFSPSGPSVDSAHSPIAGEGLILLSSESSLGNGFCISRSVHSIFYAVAGSNKIVLNHPNGSMYFTYNINRIEHEDSGDRNINIKLSSNSSLNIATKKGNQTLRMFSMNGQLVYSYSFDAAEFAGVNISLPENIFPSGIYILSLVSATEAQNFKVFVR